MQGSTRTKTGINQSLLLEQIKIVLVNLGTLALVVGAVRPALGTAGIPVKTQPGQVVFDEIGIGTRAAIGV